MVCGKSFGSWYYEVFVIVDWLIIAIITERFCDCFVIRKTMWLVEVKLRFIVIKFTECELTCLNFLAKCVDEVWAHF